MKQYFILLLPLNISLILVGIIFTSQGISEATILETNRWTARISFFTFLIVFSLRPLQSISNNTFISRQLKFRRQWGLAFGLNHLFHFMTIMILIKIVHGGDSSVITGLGNLPSYLVYLYIILMMLSSNQKSIKLLGAKAWKNFHRGGIYVIAIAFLTSFISTVMGPTPEHVLLSPLGIIPYYLFIMSLVSIWLLRITLWLKSK